VDSSPDKGTTFHIYLPYKEGLEVNPLPMKESSLQGSKKVLILEDEIELQRVFAKFLEFGGHHPVVVGDGSMAVQAYAEALRQNSPFDFVIFDLTISGGMGGAETMHRLKESYPEIQGIVTSGYSETSVMAHPEEYGFGAVLQKPFTMQELETAIIQILKQ
jgi:CheY-like chemotaxis protein